jgi:hypothetical protein
VLNQLKITVMYLFKEFNKEFFSKCKRTIKWYDKEGLFVMDKDRVVRITIDDVGTSNYYNGYWVEIINNKQGTIVKKFFRFKEHMEFTHRDTSKYFHVWYNNDKFEWYISRPKETKTMCDTIFDWVDTFMGS